MSRDTFTTPCTYCVTYYFTDPLHAPLLSRIIWMVTCHLILLVSFQICQQIQFLQNFLFLPIKPSPFPFARWIEIRQIFRRKTGTGKDSDSKPERKKYLRWRTKKSQSKVIKINFSILLSFSRFFCTLLQGAPKVLRHIIERRSLRRNMKKIQHSLFYYIFSSLTNVL